MARRINDYRCNDCGLCSEHYWDVDRPETPGCPSCGGVTTRQLAAPRISYEGAKTLRQRVPDGFKDVLKHIDKTTPKEFKGGDFTGL